MWPKKHAPADDDSSEFWPELDALKRKHFVILYIFCSPLSFRLFFVKKANFRLCHSRYYATLPRSQ